MATRQIDIFDSILREGTQSGDELSLEERIAIARIERDLGVNVIEAGFPGSNELHFETVRRIGREVRGITVCALARVHDGDISAALRALEGADRPRVHIFISTSPIHLEKKLRMSMAEALDMSIRALERIKQHYDNIEFSAEDATRSDPKYLTGLFSAAIAAGATVINIPDTVGYAYPAEYGELVRYIRLNTIASDTVKWSVHCHNDLGMAVANSLAGVLAGASQVEGCFLGRGERAGNVQLEPVIMAMHVRRDIFADCTTSIKTEELWPKCQEIARLVGTCVPDRYPIIGETSWTHSSGIHDDGVRKSRETYEIMDPKIVGWRGARRKLIAEMGTAGLVDALKEIGYPGTEIAPLLIGSFKHLASMKGELTLEDLHMLVHEYYAEQEDITGNHFHLNPENIKYISHSHCTKGYVWVSYKGYTSSMSAEGDGPIDALVRAIDGAIGKLGVDISACSFEKMNFVQGLGGSEANAWVVVHVRQGEHTLSARSAHRDTVKAAALAYLRAVNHLLNTPVVSSPEE